MRLTAADSRLLEMTFLYWFIFAVTDFRDWHNFDSRLLYNWLVFQKHLWNFIHFNSSCYLFVAASYAGQVSDNTPQYVQIITDYTIQSKGQYKTGVLKGALATYALTQTFQHVSHNSSANQLLWTAFVLVFVESAVKKNLMLLNLKYLH